MSGMSTEQPLDPQLIEQTKQQIRALYAEIAQLARSDEIGPDEFYAEMLPRVITALAAVGGVVWAKQEQGQLALQYQVNLQESRLAEKEQEDQIRHGRLLQKVMTTGEGLLVPPHSGAGDSDQAANPTEWLLVLGPLKTELEVVGVVEVFQRPEAGPPIQRGYLRFLSEVCALAGEFLNSRQLRHFSDRQTLWTQLEELTRLIHASLNPRDTAYTIANEGRRLIECDRVSVAIRKGSKCTIEAVSGQDMVDKRSNTVRLLGRLASVVVASEEPMWYTGDTRDMAPQVEDAVQEYVDESHTKMIAVLPLKRPQAAEKERERPDEALQSPRPIGALIVEQIEDSRLPQRLLSRADVVAQHSATALANSLEHESVFLMPLWRTLGKARWVTEARNVPKVTLAAVGVIALLVALFTFPADFSLRAKGSLEPVMKRKVFAGAEGKVEEILVEHGDVVEQGKLLARLQNFKLQEEINLLRGELATTAGQVARLQQQLKRLRGLTEEERIRLQGEALEKELKLASLNSQLRTYEEEQKELEVKSPSDGVIITWDLRTRLMQRPVQRGQELMEVADPRGPWQLEVYMPDDRMGYIGRAQNELCTKVRARLREVLTEQMREPVREKLRAELLAQAGSPAAGPAQAPSEGAPAVQGPPGSAPPGPAADSPPAQQSDAPPAAPQGEEPAIIRGQAPEPGEAGDRAGMPGETPAAGPTSPPSPEQAPQPPAESTAQPEPAAPDAPPEPSPETSPVAPPRDEALEKQIEELLPDRLKKEVDAALLRIPDNRLSEELRERCGEEMEDRLRVAYILATDPRTTHYGYVEEIHEAGEVHGEEGNTFKMKVAIDKDELNPEHVRTGASVTAKVECGRRAIGFVWFHDLIAFFRKTWFRWF